MSMQTVGPFFGRSFGASRDHDCWRTEGSLKRFRIVEETAEYNIIDVNFITEFHGVANRGR